MKEKYHNIEEDDVRGEEERKNKDRGGKRREE